MCSTLDVCLGTGQETVGLLAFGSYFAGGLPACRRSWNRRFLGRAIRLEKEQFLMVQLCDSMLLL